MQTHTLVITRNNPVPAILATGEQIKVLDEASMPVGLYRDTRPVITEVSLDAGMVAVVYSDGLTHAGSRTGEPMDVLGCLQTLLDQEDPSPQVLADSLLAYAMRLDQNRPVDDISVVVLRVNEHAGDEVRRMSVRLPLEP
jgi:serine phosphatase RsbU (regulator of sigma subunit)